MKKVVLVSGATGAIGSAIAEGLALEKGYEVVILSRNESKAQRYIEKLKARNKNIDLSYRIADLAEYSQIKRLRAEWKGPLHVLINNAAQTPSRRSESREGLELQFATNIMAYFWLTEEFTDLLKENAPSRVINVASYWAGNLDINDLQFQRRRYDNNTAYRQAKQANRMLTVAFAERLQAFGISVNACHPGDVNSALSRSLGFGGFQSPQEGAQTPIWLAAQMANNTKTGKYFSNKEEQDCEFSKDRKAIEALYKVCKSYAA